MAHLLEFRLPDLGEGLTDADLVSWVVGVGDHVALNQPIAEVETAKALVELPSPFEGTVAELLVEPGATVAVGSPIIRIAADGDAAPGQPARAADTERQSVLVGYGPATATVSRRRRPDAKPSARKLARELGVDLSEVPGSGALGAITTDDVRARQPTSAPADRETRTAVSGVRKRTAEAMASSARTIPQVTEFVTVDVSGSVELLEHLRGTPAFADLKLTPLALLAKIAVLALAEEPSLNSRWDAERNEIATLHYVNLGIAVASERGLLVPSIKDAHTLSLRDLCREITWLAKSARSATLSPADMRGSTFSITNIGVFRVDTGTPMVNPGEAAILCLGAIRKQPWVVHDELAVRWVTTISLSFDHRLVDGEQGSRFLANVAAMLEDPLTLLGRL